jgi:L-fuculose-phosphate aldolase
MGDTSICLMRGHGITSAGRDVQDSTITAIHLNELADINYRARLLGTPRPISDADIDTFRPMWEKTRASGKPAAGVYSLWRFYARRLQELGL